MSGGRETGRRVRHALGYIGLEMFDEAGAELDAIAAEDQALPEVRSTRVDFHIAAKQWKTAAVVAKALTRSHPEVESGWIGWAYALRELNRIEDARTVLLEAETHHGKNCAVLHYNLACYDSLLGELQSARSRLAKACRMDGQFKEAAKFDPDLVALRKADDGESRRR